MKKRLFKSKRLWVLSLVLVITLLSIGFTMSAFADDGANPDNVWKFTSSSVKDPLYVQEYFTDLPRAFEAEVNFTTSYGSASPIIANWPNYDTRDAFGFQISSNGAPTIYYYETSYNAETWTTETIKDMVKFNYNVYGKGYGKV